MPQSTLVKLFLIQLAFIFVLPSSLALAVSPVVLEQTRSMTVIFSTLNCLSRTDQANERIIEINSNFKPESHFHQYRNPKDVKLLLDYINGRPANERNDEPFTNSAENIAELQLILGAIYPNTGNWPLFYNTSVWLVNRVNGAQLFWALRITSGERYPDTVLTPSAVEVFPQLFVNKRKVANVAGVTVTNYGDNEVHPLSYFTGDPGLNEFHTHWHQDNPFWWNATKYGVKRDRKGELFLYTHHQIMNRYRAELQSNGLPDVTPLELDPDYSPPEAYYPDIININYKEFPRRRKKETLRDFDDGTALKQIRTEYNRVLDGIDQGYFKRKDGSQESLRYENGTDILGATFESSPVESVNWDYYGNVHNEIHRLLGRVVRPQGPTPGVMSHAETGMRDRVFYRLHKLVDNVYYRLKMKAEPYTRQDLEYRGVSIKSVEVYSSQSDSKANVLSTHFTWEKYDIATSARPCRGIGEEPAFINVKILDHTSFNYVITLKSTKSNIAHGMVRIFLLPEFDHDGSKLDADESHHRAIELDRFRIELEPNEETTITRASTNSSVTRERAQPKIKALYERTSKSGSGNKKLRRKLTRSCGWPRNLLIPKGTKDGLSFKLTVMVSEEDEPENGSEFPNYPYCGVLNGIKFPDSRPMGYPFDRPGTRFVSYDGIWGFLGGYEYKNVKQIPVVIQHKEN